MGHSWGKIDHYGFVPFSYICPSFNKKTIRVSMIYSEQKMVTADRDCRLYSVDGILQTGNGCGSETFFCNNGSKSGG